MATTSLPKPTLKPKTPTAALPTAVADDASTGAVLSLSNEPTKDVGGVVI